MRAGGQWSVYLRGCVGLLTAGSMLDEPRVCNLNHHGAVWQPGKPRGTRKVRAAMNQRVYGRCETMNQRLCGREEPQQRTQQHTGAAFDHPYPNAAGVSRTMLKTCSVASWCAMATRS